eukprot:INCI15450.2.p1 GENE.INCI15450.2~~INCI15450.2.p1  ORF type:complete len:919 (-),score=152.61 INCI15450.2:1524-3983(-)
MEEVKYTLTRAQRQLQQQALFGLDEKCQESNSWRTIGASPGSPFTPNTHATLPSIQEAMTKFSTVDQDLTRRVNDAVAQQLLFYRNFVHEFERHEAMHCATCVHVVADLNPKYARVYEAAGQLVKNQRGYQSFNNLEAALFSSQQAGLASYESSKWGSSATGASTLTAPKACEVNDTPLRQPVGSIPRLLMLSALSKPWFDRFMNTVVQSVDISGLSPIHSDCPNSAASLWQMPGVLELGGVTWSAAPLKSAVRIVEKLVLSPAQRPTLEKGSPNDLDATSILDSVRGMFICSTMRHATAVLSALALEAERGTFRLGRSKNRFARPSAGGWMDCLINVVLRNGLVCEVQIVHRQLLTVRSELGAHLSYFKFRAATELLECAGMEELVLSEHSAKRCVLRTALGMFGDSFAGQARHERKSHSLHRNDSCSGGVNGTADQRGGDVASTKTVETGIFWPSGLSDQNRLVAAQTWGVSRAWPYHAWPSLMYINLSFLPSDALRNVHVRIPRRGSLAEAILRHNLDGVHAYCAPAAASELLGVLSNARKAICESGHSVKPQSPDAKQLCKFGNSLAVRMPLSPDSALVLPQPLLLSCLAAARHDGNGITSLATCDDPTCFVSGSLDHTARLWELNTGRLVRTFRHHTAAVTAVAMVSLPSRHKHDFLVARQPNGSVRGTGAGRKFRLLTASADHTFCLWDASNARLLRAFAQHRGVVKSVCFSNTGRILASGSDDRSAKLWNAKTGRVLRNFECRASVNAVALVRNDKWLLTGTSDAKICVWAVRDGSELRTFSGHGMDWVTSLAVTPDQTSVLSGSWDGKFPC